jgi:hypothetical protein
MSARLRHGRSKELPVKPFLESICTVRIGMLVRRRMMWDTPRVALVRRLKVLWGVHSAAAAIVLKTWKEQRKDEKERMSE